MGCFGFQKNRVCFTVTNTKRGEAFSFSKARTEPGRRI